MRGKRLGVVNVRSGILCAMSAAGALALAAGAGAQALQFAAPPIEGTKLYLRTGDVDTTQARPDLGAIASRRSLSPDARFVLQLDGPMTPERRAKLEDAGVTLGAYLPANAYVATLTGVDRAKAAALDFVRWADDYKVEWKVDVEVGRRTFTSQERLAIIAAGQAALVVHLFEGATAEEIAGVEQVIKGLDNAELYQREDLAGSMTFTVRINLPDVGALATLPAVQFVEEAPEITYRNSTNRWIVQSNIAGVTPLYDAGIHGEGQVLGILDTRVDVNHCSFRDTAPVGPTHRKVLAYNTTSGAASHGTHCAGTAVGDNGDNTDTRGIAYAGRLVFNVTPSFTESAMNTSLTTHHNQGARVHTNSWGNDGTTSYDGLCRGVDVFSYNNEEDLVLFAVTNTSTLKNPENAKNLLAVGASQDTPNQGSFCSGGTGLTSDQRRKPEIYAPGCGTSSASSGTTCGVTANTGTSMACPAVAGTAMLVRQYYMDGFYPSGLAESADAFTPSAALIKATLLNSAVDMTGIAGFPSNQEGWGRVLADNALYFDGDARALIVEDVRNSGGLSTSGLYEQTVNVLSSGQPLKVTLAYTEPAATAGASLATVNDLDLEVISPTGDIYRGNVFSAGVSATGGTKDARNNVEQALFAAPAAGPWIVRVIGAAVNTGAQGFALVITGEVSLGPAPLTIAASGVPSLLAPGEIGTFNVVVNPRDDALVPGSAKLFVRTSPAGPFVELPLTPDSGASFVAALPAFLCEAEPQFYVAAEGVTTGVKTAPSGAPANLYSAEVGVLTVGFTDDMEIDRGWTVGAAGDNATSGIWVRVNPVGTVAQPEDDVTGGAGTMCWVTGQGVVGGASGAADVDNGRTTLVSPLLDLSGDPDAKISYWRWYSNSSGASPGGDTFRVDATSDGSNWVNVETVGPTGPEVNGGWVFREFRAADFVATTSTVRVRFIAEDLAPGSVVEAAVDEFKISSFNCENIKPCPADLDGDGQVGASDLASLLGAWGVSGPADLDGDGSVGSSDLASLLGAWGPCA